MKIGIFDSGLGGLTVLSFLQKLLPEEEYYYYADSDHVPYGTKTGAQIYEYSKEAVSFLINKGCDIVCIACNTATSVAAEGLRKSFDIPIVGIEPAVKPAVAGEHKKDERILVVATPVTVKEKKLHELIDRFDEAKQVDMKALPELPVFAEKGIFDGEEIREYLKKEFADVNVSVYSKVVLGCTHFIHFINLFREIFNDDVVFLDGCEGTANNIYRRATQAGFPGAGAFSIEFYRSGKLVTDDKDLQFFNMILERLEKNRIC